MDNSTKWNLRRSYKMIFLAEARGQIDSDERDAQVTDRNRWLGSDDTEAERAAALNGAMEDVADILDAGDEKVWRVLVEYDNGHSGDWTSPLMSRAEAEVMRKAEDRATSYGWIMDIHGRLEDYGGTRYKQAPKFGRGPSWDQTRST